MQPIANFKIKSEIKFCINNIKLIVNHIAETNFIIIIAALKLEK
jgi:hypothetical protein